MSVFYKKKSPPSHPHFGPLVLLLFLVTQMEGEEASCVANINFLGNGFALRECRNECGIFIGEIAIANGILRGSGEAITG